VFALPHGETGSPLDEGASPQDILTVYHCVVASPRVGRFRASRKKTLVPKQLSFLSNNVVLAAQSPRPFPNGRLWYVCSSEKRPLQNDVYTFKYIWQRK